MRSKLASEFIAKTQWSDTEMAMIAGDASNRKYYRLRKTDSGETAILMNAPPDKGENVVPFVLIAQHLESIGLNPPSIYAKDEANGFLLLEDLGDDLLARLAPNGSEFNLYKAAVDALLHLHQSPLPETPLEKYSAAEMAPLGCLSIEWYAQNAKGTGNAKAELEPALFAAIEATEIATPVLVLRDYHAENLLWTPMFEAPKNIGLLDFQDARVGQPTYDLVSLLGDARRDVSKPVRDDLLQYYQSESGIDPDKFSASCAVQSAQRNLRILGVFARLCIRDGKPSYLDFIPRVWANLKQDLQHPSLSSVAQIVIQNIPEPTPEILNLLRRKCPTNHH